MVFQLLHSTLLLALAGGGRSSGDGGDFGGGSYDSSSGSSSGGGGVFVAVFGFIAVVGLIIVIAFTIKRKQDKAQRAAAQATVQSAAASDPAWDQQTMQKRIETVFDSYERDWSSFNVENIKTYTTERYFTHMRLLLTALQQLGRRNDVQEPQLENSTIIDAVDDPDNTKDRFTAKMTASATDVLLNVADNQKLYETSVSIQESWHFVRRGNDWLLDGITQPTEDENAEVQAMKTFAMQNGMFYSLDMGRLLLPQRGQLFSSASFTDSDINNHVIGEWRGLIVQLYTYAKRANSSDSVGFDNTHNGNFNKVPTYVIGQLTLPKAYGGIIVKRKDQGGMLSHLFSGAPKGYQEVAMEWPDFNNRYSVYATDMDKVTSFELLNPAYMTKLYDLNLPISIEVVDTVVYFFAEAQSVAADANQYAAMLGVLQAAFTELKM